MGVQINGKAVIAMLDSGASHSFVADREIQKLGLTIAQHSNRIKEVNSEAKPTQGMACVELKVSTWTGKCNLMAVPLDDFDVILGMDFLLLANAIMKAGLRYGEQSYLAALIEVKSNVGLKNCKPLKDLLRKDQKWEWTFACDDAFRLMLLIGTWGCVGTNKHPVAFESCKLKDAELRYNIHEKEMTIKRSPKQARWQEFLGEFDFEWVYRPGKHNNVADVVSRKLVEEYVAALTVDEFDFLDQNRESSKMDAGYLKLVFVPTGTLRLRLLRKFSTANHPQTDGQTERVNTLVEDYLRDYVSASQRNWVDLLDFAQFSSTLHKSSATGMSPFELAYRQQPTTPHEISVQKTSGKCLVANRFARSKQELLDEAKDSLAKALCRMKKYADMGRRHVEFIGGDQVLLKLTPQIWKNISSKYVHWGQIPKYDRPFEVVSKVGSLLTFHVSFPKKFHQDLLDTARQQTQCALPVIRKEFEKTMLKIFDHRTMSQSKRKRWTDYLVHWSGESEADATWERDVTLWQFEEKLDEYWAVREGVTLPKRASGSSGGGGL
ncbi:Transposon Ty3-I Gag-Pol polyprotein [Sesamum angolense]|uniref:Transposon Ty3-I Gag-Pol polyprotein n=1 Tax=Sesamum angolense TaxID=2727404 RepID=A0AAE1VVQ7_9LAMI|nr:Transposon Ty3-I Gag-Pol polyprotein [Sesamum angolense]